VCVGVGVCVCVCGGGVCVCVFVCVCVCVQSQKLVGLYKYHTLSVPPMTMYVLEYIIVNIYI